MTGNDLDYDDILRRWKRTREQAANDLERYLLREELPDPGSVARAIVTLRSELEPVRHAHWWLERDPDGKPYCFHCSSCDADGHYIGITTCYDYCPNCGAKMEEDNGEKTRNTP